MEMNIGAGILSAAIGVILLVLIVPRAHTALTGRCLWSPGLLRRVDAALTAWTAVLARDWTLLLGRVREMAQHTAESPRAGGRFMLGLLALLLGPVVVMLNAVILAQILEIFLPGSAEMLAIPYLGEFMPFPSTASPAPRLRHRRTIRLRRRICQSGRWR